MTAFYAALTLLLAVICRGELFKVGLKSVDVGTSSSKWGQGKDAMIDGDAGTRWHQDKGGKVLTGVTVTLEAPAKVAKVVVKIAGSKNYGFRKLSLLEVQGMPNIQTWVNLPCKFNRESEFVIDSDKRKVMSSVTLALDKRCGGGYYAINEIEIWGERDDTKPVTPAPVKKVTPAPVGKPGGHEHHDHGSEDERFKAPNSFPIYIEIMNEEFTLAKYRGEDRNDPKFGFMTLHVTPGMSIRQVMNMANFKKWKPNDHTTMAFDREHNPWRDDGGRKFHDRSVMTKNTRNFDSGYALFSTAHYGGYMLNPDSTIKDNGIRDQSLIFLKTYGDNNVDPQFSFDFTSADIPLDGIDQVIEVYYRASVWNLYNQICEKTGRRRGTFAIQGYKRTFYPVKPANHMDNVDAKYKNYWRMHAWWNSQHSEVVADPLKFFIQDPASTTDFDTLLLQIRDIVRDFYDEPEADLLKIIDLDIVSANCKCLTVDEYTVESHLIPKKMRNARWGMGCKDHDESKAYCTKPSKRAEGNRDCWCPLKWCYTTEACGLPSKTTPGLFYSYDLPDCNNNEVAPEERNCYATDEEGEIDEIDLMDFDLWNFETVVDYLQTLLVSLAEAVPDFNDHLSD